MNKHHASDMSQLNPLAAEFMTMIHNRVKDFGYPSKVMTFLHPCKNPEKHDTSYACILKKIYDAGTIRRTDLFEKKMKLVTHRWDYNCSRRVSCRMLVNENRGRGVHMLQHVINAGLAVRTPEGYKLTDDGKFYVESIMPMLMSK